MTNTVVACFWNVADVIFCVCVGTYVFNFFGKFSVLCTYPAKIYETPVSRKRHVKVGAFFQTVLKYRKINYDHCKCSFSLKEEKE